MKYTIPIFLNGTRNPVWNNFMRSIKLEKYKQNGVISDNMLVWINYRTCKLAEFNAKFDGKNIVFENEQDKLFFLLRWS